MTVVRGRARTAAMAPDAESRLRELLDSMAEGVAETTLDGRLVSANRAFATMLGYESAEELIANVPNVSALYADPAERSALVARARSDDLPDHSDIELRDRDGREIWVRARFHVGRDAGVVSGLHVITENVTARRHAEEETAAALRLVEARVGVEAALADLARLTLEAADIGTFGKTACGLVSRLLQVEFCAILLPGDDGSLHIVSEWGWDRRMLAMVDTAPDADSQAAYTFGHGATVIVDDWLTEPRFTRSPLLEAHHVQSGLTVPIRYGQSTVGTLGVQSNVPRRFDDSAVRLLESVAQLFGVALEQDNVCRRLIQSERTLQAIVDNAPVAIHVVDPEGRFLLVNRELERISGMPRDLLLGRTRAEVPRLVDGSPLEFLVDDLDAARSIDPVAIEQRTMAADGEHSYLSVHFPLAAADGRTYGVGGISTDVTDLVRARAETTSAWLESMDRLAKAVEFRDDSTGAHIERMAAYSDLIARLLGLPADRCAQIRAAAPMHDIGKMAIPDHVLLKPGQFTPEERTIMNAHADIGFRLLTGSGSDALELAATIALSHHERFDGSGYPNGLIGADIPIEGRIVAIADSFDALTSDRVYRTAMPIDRAIEVMQDEIGHFDPEILALFVRDLDLA